METLLALAAFSLNFTTEVRDSALPGLVLAVLGAIVAAYAGWHATDRLIAWRERPEQD